MGRRGGVVEWDRETIDLVKGLVLNDGLSARQIADRIGGTRNAVIGRMHRLGIAGGGGECRRPPREASRAVALRPIVPKPLGGKGRVARIFHVQPKKVAKPRIERDLPVPEMAMITVVELTPTTCRWPIGDPSDLDTFRYCGNWAVDRPYCPHHCGLAYETVSERRNQREKEQCLRIG